MIVGSHLERHLMRCRHPMFRQDSAGGRKTSQSDGKRRETKVQVRGYIGSIGQLGRTPWNAFTRLRSQVRVLLRPLVSGGRPRL